MKTRAALFKFRQGYGHEVHWDLVSIHPTVKAAHAQVIFLGGRLASLGRYSDNKTYVIKEVESYE